MPVAPVTLVFLRLNSISEFGWVHPHQRWAQLHDTWSVKQCHYQYTAVQLQ